jgi:hypothetical protein
MGILDPRKGRGPPDRLSSAARAARGEVKAKNRQTFEGTGLNKTAYSREDFLVTLGDVRTRPAVMVG